MKLEIALIDDKEHWINQVKSLHSWENFHLDYFDTFMEFKKTRKKYDLIYLDYYLDKDNLRWEDIIHEIYDRADKIIWFSSVERCNKILRDMGAEYSVLKI